MQSDVIITLWDKGDAKWFLSLVLDERDVTVCIGAGNAKKLIDDLKIPYANPLDKSAVPIKEADIKAKAEIISEDTLEIILPNGLKANVVFYLDPIRIQKLLAFGIGHKNQ